ncbi:MAG: TIGR03087 family PEP-CTERM/XrtA system glycosyltransferase [Moraxellaceae bacterium]|nr:TIGR03087 family PEP-CTERM/XrtA system glycosyltransferase [Moraxellaceae bacterium]
MPATDARPPLLYLVHRIPYPPNKGDKVRSFNLLRHLSRRWRVYLGTFVDHPDDWQHVPALSEWCVESRVEGLQPRTAKLLSLRGLLGGEALTLPYYRNRRMQRWVADVVAREGIRHTVVFSSSMAQYVADQPALRRVVDFCDVDSAKWTRYAADHKGAMAWLYRREGRLLADFERRIGEAVDASVLATEAEAELFRSVAPAASSRTHAISNGVNAEFFAPEAGRSSPYESGEQAVVFTGAMDYWPNIDAVCWFARDIWPVLRTRFPQARFYAVGMNPSEEVRALAELPGVIVTGTVPDVRPYVQHAAAVVAPLRIARGVQNKILEAMAMGRPVVAARTCAQGLDARAGEDLLLADSVDDYVDAVSACLDGRRDTAELGRHARARVLASYSWDAHLARIDPLLQPLPT